MAVAPVKLAGMAMEPGQMTMTKAGSTTIAALVLAASSLLFVGCSLHFFNNVEDDAFIPMRYARNFWHGAGWVMNPGERVEGCTSPLQLWFVTLLMRFFSPDHTLWISKFVGLGVGLAVLLQARRLGQALFPQTPWVGNLTPLVVALRPDFAASMTNGLETGWAALLLTAGTAEFVRACRASDVENDISWRAALLFLGAALARPEFSLTFPLLLAGRFLADDRKRPGLIAFLWYAGPLAVFLGWRLAYYHALVPNTYWAKQLPISDGLAFGTDYLSFYALPGALIPALLLYGMGMAASVRHGGAARFALPTILGLQTLFVLRAGGDWMADGRFFCVVLPLCAVVWLGALWQVSQSAAWITSRFPAGRQAAYGLAGLLFAGAAVCFTQDTLRRTTVLDAQPNIHDITWALAPHRALQEWKVSEPEGRLVLAQWVSAHARPGQTVLASEMGLAPLLNPKIRFLDMRGLTDAAIARMPGYGRTQAGVQGERQWMERTGPLGRYIRQRQPAWVALLWNVNVHNLNSIEAANDLYVPSGTFPIRCNGCRLIVATWRRRDVADPTREQGAPPA